MNKSRKTYQILNIILLALAMACLFYYDYEGGLWLKGVTSAWFVLLGAVNLVYARKQRRGNARFLLLAELGLILAMTADVLLGVNFIIGALVFALGHVFTFAGFCALERFTRRDVLIILPVCALSLFIALGTPFIHVNDPIMKAMLFVYAVVISFMLGKAIGIVRIRRSLARNLLLLGGALFWFSDLMLALNLFGDGGHLASLLCLYTYWPGQYLIAHSLFHHVNESQA